MYPRFKVITAMFFLHTIYLKFLILVKCYIGYMIRILSNSNISFYQFIGEFSSKLSSSCAAILQMQMFALVENFVENTSFNRGNMMHFSLYYSIACSCAVSGCVGLVLIHYTSTSKIVGGFLVRLHFLWSYKPLLQFECFQSSVSITEEIYQQQP